MARRKKDAPILLADSHELTVGLIDGLTCPQGKTQAFLRDSKSPGLRVRVTAAGSKSYVFEGKLNRQTIRQTIGDVRAWSIDAARAEANRLRVLLDRGTDPRELARDTRAAKAAKAIEAAGRALTVADVWPRYMAEGKPKRRATWKPRYVADLMKAASPGGEPKKRGAGATKPGHLAALMPLSLASIDQDVIREWYAYEGKTAPIPKPRRILVGAMVGMLAGGILGAASPLHRPATNVLSADWNAFPPGDGRITNIADGVAGGAVFGALIGLLATPSRGAARRWTFRSALPKPAAAPPDSAQVPIR